MAKRGIDAFFSSSAKKQKTTSIPATTAAIHYDSHKSYPIPLPGNFPFALASNDSHRVIDDKEDLELLYYQPLFPAPIAAQLYEFLRDEFCWYRVTYQVRGMTINTPRYTTVFGLDSTHTFSAESSAGLVEVETGQPPKKPLKCVPRPIPGCLQDLRRLVEAHSGGATFNFCLLNYYKDGTDSISYHSDDEHFLGPDPSIASISLGAARDFHMRNKADHSITFKTLLKSGDMVVMKGKTQAKWDHAVPKRKGKEIGGRINITFRRAVVRYGTENYYRYNVHDGPYYRWDNEQGTMVLGSSWQPRNMTSKTLERSSGPAPARPMIPAQKAAKQENSSDVSAAAAASASATHAESLKPDLKTEESFDVERAVAAIEAASNGEYAPIESNQMETAIESTNHDPPIVEKEDSFDLEAQIRAIDEAVARASER